MRRDTFSVPNGEGWLLDVRRTWCPQRVQSDERPLILIPGYGNNSEVFAYPDPARSMEGFFARHGREVWSVNLRGQGASKREKGSRVFGVDDLALTDLGAVLDFVVRHTQTSREKVDAIGASLGGTALYVHSALQQEHVLGKLVAIGSPLRWVNRHPLIAMALKRPGWVGWVPVRGSRLFLRTAFPLLKHFPIGLRAYIHPQTLASPDIRKLVAAVDDPNRHLTRQLAEWIAQRDLIVRGENVTEALSRSQNPLLCVLGNADGIVPSHTALSAIEASGARQKDVLRVGTRQLPFGHTDPFIHRDAPQKVFRPVFEWLRQP
jgi:pimeloyl-ACP methyl ester carboxylesterase